MATQFEIDCAVMAGHAYLTNRAKINWFPVPEGWTEFFHVPNDTYPTTAGFEAIAFQKESDPNRIVIAYTGTDQFSDWTSTNVPLAFGQPSDQLYQAALYYLQIKAVNSDAVISFTGHSMGGGLAALMGVLFDEQAVTFDQAPFAAAATTFIRDDLVAWLINEQGYDQMRLQELAPELFTYEGGVARVGNISGYYVEGEAMQVVPPISMFSTLGTTAPLSHGSYLGPVDLHSQALLTAFLENQDFEGVTAKLPDLLAMLFDGNLFAYPTDKSNDKNPNFLERLIQHEAGVQGSIPTDAMLDRFTADLWKLAQDGGLTLHDNNPSNPDVHDVSNALIAFAMQFYYQDTADAIDPSKELFGIDGLVGGIRFDIQDVAASLNDAKGYSQYFKNYLDSANNFKEGEQALIKPLLPTLRDWYVQAGANGMTATDTQNRGAFMLGGAGSDSLTGGDRTDLLVGNAGADTLQGAKGNDTLLGGAGFDTYVLNPGDGYDTILDADGQGVVTMSGAQAKGSATEGLDPTKWIQIGKVWQDQEHGIAYALVNQADGSKTLLIRDPSGGTVEVKDWSENTLGIQLGAGSALTASPLPTATYTVTGDLKPADTDTTLDGVQQDYDAFGNLIVGSEADPGREDLLYDSDADDHLQGLGGNDSLLAVYGVGDDLLEGGEGEDVLVDDYGADTLVGGEGRDILRTWSGGDDQLFAEDRITDLAAYIQSSETETGSGQSGDWLSAGFGNDTLVGGTGNDVLLGGQGQDLMIGGAGDDYIRGDEYGYADRGWALTITEEQSGDHTLYIPNISDGTIYPATEGAADVIYGGAGNDWINGNAGNDILDGGADNDALWGGDGHDVVLGGKGDDVLSGDNGYPDTEAGGNDLLDGGEGNDTLWGNGGNDILDGGEGDDYLDGGYGNDVVKGGGGSDTLNGGAGNDYLNGGAGNDSLHGGEGNDTLIGSDGDVLNGGAGDDTYIINGQVNVEIYDNEGKNTLLLTNVASLDASMLSIVNGQDAVDAIRLDLGNGQFIQFSSNFGTLITIQAQDGSALNLEKWAAENVTQNLTLYLGEDGSTLYGGAGADTLYGGAGVDNLYGNAGDDELWGVDSDDYLYGGAGGDYLIAGPGDDILDGGDGNDWMWGYEGNDLLLGGDGDDTLRGLSGADTLVGGNGNDTYFIPSGEPTPDIVIEEVDSGIDEVWNFNSSYTLGANVENLYLDFWGFADVDGTGNELDNYILGNTGNNVLTGEAGNDTLLGKAGIDTLIGGSGDDYLDGGSLLDGAKGDGVGDIMIGGFGNDTYTVKDVADTIIEESAQGLDWVYSYLATYTLPDNVEALSILTSVSANGTGNALDNSLMGNDYANTMDGGDGGDTLGGNGGDDSLFGGAGGDQLFGGTGNDLLDGGADDDALWGDGGSDVLYGQAGNDLINGGTGADQMFGGSGDDRYLVDNAGDVVTENPGEGVDIVTSLIASFALPEEVENLELQYGWAGISGIGNSLNNELQGNAADNMLRGLDGADKLSGREGNDFLDGGNGPDQLYGGTGDDAYIVNDNGDLIVELANEGTDTVYSSVSRALEANVENLVLTGDLAIDGTGNGLSNNIVGNYAANILAGGAGDDTYTVGLGDSVVEYFDEGIDTVITSETYVLGGNIENLTLLGNGAINGTGNTLDNVLTGNDAANKLAGGDGDDTYIIGAGDAVVEKHGAGQDTVVSLVSYTLGRNLENLTLVGAEAISGTGNSLDNRLTGNSLDNALSGGRGNDTLAGGSGADALDGGTGNDTYIFGRGDGADLITDFQSRSNTDILGFGPDITAEQIWFKQSGNDLEVSIIGTQDSVTIKDWYSGSAYHIEQISLADGEVLLDTQVQMLVDAMASFAPPAAGQTTLPQNYQDELAGVIAASWQ